MIDSLVKYVTGIIRLRGSTDGTAIGNVGDSLKVSVEEMVQNITVENDVETKVLLTHILVELKEMNSHLREITENDEYEGDL